MLQQSMITSQTHVMLRTEHKTFDFLPESNFQQMSQ